jgi:hypothetical protein
VNTYLRLPASQVFNAQAQSGIHYVERLAAAGVRQFRVELVDERAAEVGPLLEGYAAVLRGDRSADSLWEWLQVRGNHSVSNMCRKLMRPTFALSLFVDK